MINIKLTEEELNFLENFYNPKCLIETTFPKGKNVNAWNEGGECIKIRLYQVPMLTYDSCLEDDSKLSEQENFRLRLRAGTLILICGRKIGKTFIALVGNILKALLHYSGLEMTMSSYDEGHVNKVLDDVRSFFVTHLLYKQFKRNVKGSPEYKIETNNGNILFGVNENISKGQDQGKNWWGKHTSLNFQDEVQAETETAHSKKIDAIGELGCIDVLCGIPLVTKTSPLGKILKDRDKAKMICRLPQYVSPFWNDEVRKDRIKDYGGENSVGYKVNVEAEDIEGAQGAFDMERVRLNYNSKRIIKRFEISKNNFAEYKRILVLEPMRNSSKTFVSADIGDASATEIGVHCKINDKYQLVYNITAFRLATKETIELMAYIFNQVGGHFISVDCTIMGKPIYEGLSDLLNIVEKDAEGNIVKIHQRVFWCAFNENIVTGFETDNQGCVVRDKQGNAIEKTENTLIFAVQRLRELFYEKKFDIPEDDIKFDEEFSGYVMTASGTKVIFGSTTTDHYVQMMQVFAILEWLTEQLPAINPNKAVKKLSLGLFN
jgi:hypothetical protein